MFYLVSLVTLQFCHCMAKEHSLMIVVDQSQYLLHLYGYFAGHTSVFFLHFSEREPLEVSYAGCYVPDDLPITQPTV